MSTPSNGGREFDDMETEVVVAPARGAQAAQGNSMPPPRPAGPPPPAYPQTYPAPPPQQRLGPPAQVQLRSAGPPVVSAPPIPVVHRADFGRDASSITDESILRLGTEPPTMGWRHALYVLSGGLWNPGISKAEVAQRQLLHRVRRQLRGTHQIAVSSLKGGVGKTTVAAGLGLTLAEYRGDRVVAVDANPDSGTLADRLNGEVGVTVRQMLDDIASIDSMTAVSRYTSLAGRLQVLASEQDPAMSEAFNRAEYEQICAVLARFFNVIITDSGTGLVHSAMEGTLALADSLVVVGSPTVDGASRASKTLDWLIAHGYEEQVANGVVVLSCDRVSPQIDREWVLGHFRSRCRAVIEMPFDPHLAAGGRLNLTAMRQPTRTAFLELAALVADEFPKTVSRSS
jgi:MinD-like ATPase involved in chromosome partitioning or flagellar assembly